jgi:hypothetical protein
MGYAMLAIRTAAEDDGRLYPVVGDEQSPVELESLDGSIEHLKGRAVTVSELVPGGFKTIARFRDVNIDLLITESRVALCCDKYEKGGGWVGVGAGAFVAVAANGVSKARAAHRRRGKTLVGQVRYSWLRCVGYKPKAGWGSREQLRLGVVVKLADGATRELFLDVALTKGIDSKAAAQAIITCAARYRLDHTVVEDTDERRRFEELARTPELARPEPKKFALCQMPSYFFVSAGTAHPVPGVVREEALAS